MSDEIGKAVHAVPLDWNKIGLVMGGRGGQDPLEPPASLDEAVERIRVLEEKVENFELFWSWMSGVVKHRPEESGGFVVDVIRTHMETRK
jgi:hypothetical protein